MQVRTAADRIGTSLVLIALIASACNSSSGASPSPAGARGGLANSDWLLSTMVNQPIASGTYLDLHFGLLQASGFGGCNQFSATYSTDGVSTLSFGTFPATLMACGTAAMAFETAYLSALGQVASYTMIGGNLTLAGPGGATLLTYAPQPAGSIVGPWLVTMYNNGSGAVTTVPQDITIAVSFLEDETIEGFGGCNSFSGGYSTSGQNLQIGPMASTQKSCGSTVDPVEQQFLAALGNSTKWSVSNGTLDLTDASGSKQVEAKTAIGGS